MNRGGEWEGGDGWRWVEKVRPEFTGKGHRAFYSGRAERPPLIDGELFLCLEALSGD